MYLTYKPSTFPCPARNLKKVTKLYLEKKICISKYILAKIHEQLSKPNQNFDEMKFYTDLLIIILNQLPKFLFAIKGHEK